MNFFSSDFISKKKKFLLFLLWHANKILISNFIFCCCCCCNFNVFIIFVRALSFSFVFVFIINKTHYNDKTKTTKRKVYFKNNFELLCIFIISNIYVIFFNCTFYYLYSPPPPHSFVCAPFPPLS